MTHLYAFSFRSALSLPQVLGRFRRLCSWRWIERENDDWGAYISARALGEPHDGLVKVICDDHGGYVINVYLRSDQPDAGAAFSTVRETVFQRLLPGVQATDICETDDLES